MIYFIFLGLLFGFFFGFLFANFFILNELKKATGKNPKDFKSLRKYLKSFGIQIKDL